MSSTLQFEKQRFLEQDGDIDRFEDCVELARIAAQHDVFMTPLECLWAWNAYSDSMAAGWMGFDNTEHTAQTLHNNRV